MKNKQNKQNKKNFEESVLNVIKLETTDIITTSEEKHDNEPGSCTDTPHMPL